MKVIRKDAAIENTGADADFPGTFRVVLSAPTEDRDGDTLLPEEWKLPLPDHITFDTDHGMSVATTVGSGVPSLDDDGRLIVDGTYSSLDRAQEVRTLVKEQHIRTTSVAFMTVPSKAKGAIARVRELLNGAFVAVPSNREAIVLESKAATQKVGARNSSTDAQRIQQILDLALELGASADASGDDEDDGEAEVRAFRRNAGTKAVAGSLEALQERIREALREAYTGWVWIRATMPADDGAGEVIFELEDPDTYDTATWRESYTDDGETVTLGGNREAVEVEVTETVTPASSEPTPAGAAVDSAAVAAATAAEKAAAPAIEDELSVSASRLKALITKHSGKETP